MNRFDTYSKPSSDNAIDIELTDVFSDITTEKPAPESFDSAKGYDLSDFLEDVMQLFTKYTEATNDFKDFSFGPERVYDTVAPDEGNAIRYSVVNRTIATTTQGNNAHAGRIDYRWRPRGEYADVKNPGYKVTVYEKAFDNTIRFTSWSKNYRDANKMALKFEEIMDLYDKYFKKNGLLLIRYEGRDHDMFNETSGYAMYGCPMIFYVKTNELKLAYDKVIESLKIEIKHN